MLESSLMRAFSVEQIRLEGYKKDGGIFCMCCNEVVFVYFIFIVFVTFFLFL